MPQSLMVVATERGTGKSVLSLGLLDQFERHGIRLAGLGPEDLAARLRGISGTGKVRLLAPVIRARKGFHKDVFEAMARRGHDVARGTGVVLARAWVPDLARPMHRPADISPRRLPHARRY